MNDKNRQQLGIYIHIPFCMKKCNYCDFLSGPAGKKEIEDYTNALLGEIYEAGERYKNYQVKSIFIGGGTPSILPGEKIGIILEKVREGFLFMKETEITIEANPGTLTKDKLSRYKEAGINRLSIGLQSAHAKELEVLGRIHKYPEFLESFGQARELGFSNINVDLMFGLPEQTKESWEDTLTKVLGLQPEHISAYGLIVEEKTPFYERELNLPQEEDERLMHQMTNILLKENGYEHYEISNYARKGYECVHNLGYWRRGDYLGLGTGAASLIEHTRFSNVSDIADYVKNSRNLDVIHEEQVLLTEKEEMEEFMFLGLRTLEGVSKEVFNHSFSKSFDDLYGSLCRKLEEEGLLRTYRKKKGEREEEMISLSEKGIDISNYVMAQFLQ